MLVYEGGRIVQTGSPQAVISRPASAEIARLLGHTNILRVEILALDPGRNTSRVRYGDFEFCGPYLPGHLIGDQTSVVLRADDLRVHTRPGENRFPMRLQAKVDHARAVELQFAGGICALVPRYELDGRADVRDWYVEIPPAALRLVGTH